MSEPVIMQKVQSSNVDSVGYDEEKLIVHVQFIGGVHYIYKDVPKQLFDDLLKAPSVGAFLNRNFKNSYLCDELPSFAALEKAAKPLIAYFKKFYCPHDHIIVSYDSILVVNEQMSSPIEVED